MARATRKSSSAKSGGSTLFGLLAGLILGLAVAVAVALFVTKAPMPFVDKASRAPEQTALPDVRQAPDPNSALYGKGQAGTMPSGPVDTTIAPPAPDAGANAMSDDIDRLIASLGQAQQERPGTAPAQAPAPSPAAKPSAATQTTYYLQAGAFRSESDAEAMKARILMLGLTASIQRAQIDGGTMHRVRVGPFNGIDDMNRSRARLGQENIASSVVRP